jgi:hypothetical protein
MVIAKIRIARMKTDSFNVHLFLSTACDSSRAKSPAFMRLVAARLKPGLAKDGF